MLKLSLLVGLVGCATPGPLFSDHDGPRGAVYDDGTSIRVTGCPDGAAFGCHTPAPGDAMTATVDGVKHVVPESSEGAMQDQLLGVFSDGPYQLTLPRPADGRLGLELAGAVGSFVLPTGFAVTRPTAQVSRAQVLTIQHEVLPGAQVWGLILTTCGTREHTDLVEEQTPGVLEVAFPSDFAGTCTHDIHVDQRVVISGGELAIDAIRIAQVAVTSTP